MILYLVSAVLLLIASGFLLKKSNLKLRMELYWEFGIFPTKLTKKMIAGEIVKLYLNLKQSEDGAVDLDKSDQAAVTSAWFTLVYGESPFSALNIEYEKLMKD